MIMSDEIDFSASLSRLKPIRKVDRQAWRAMQKRRSKRKEELVEVVFCLFVCCEIVILVLERSPLSSEREVRYRCRWGSRHNQIFTAVDGQMVDPWFENRKLATFIIIQCLGSIIKE